MTTDPESIVAGHDGELLRALKTRGLTFNTLEEIAIIHGTYTEKGLGKYAGMNPGFARHVET